MTTTLTRDFSAKTRRALAQRGIRLLSPTLLPDARGSFANGDRAYNVDDNGTGRIWRFAEVLAAAEAR